MEWLKAPKDGYRQMNQQLVSIPDEPKFLIQALMDHGYEAFVVGGCVRDSILGRTPHDWDICTNALPEQMKSVFCDLRVLDTGLKHGTITVVLQNGNYEITTYRKDGNYSDHRHPDQVQFVSDLKEDLSRRDFTINAMAANINGEIIDYFDGQHDLFNHEIVCVGKAEQRFEEDALRILRAMRFASRYGFGIEKSTAEAMHMKRNLLQEIAAERIGNEFLQIMGGKCDWLLRFFTDIFSVIVPEIYPCVGFEQNNDHHDWDVWEHTIRTVGAVNVNRTVKIAALYHDLGKPLCMSVDENGISHFYGHAKISAQLAEKSLRNLRIENKLIEEIVQLVEAHDRVLEPRKNIVRRCLNQYGTHQFMNLVYLQYADQSSKKMNCQNESGIGKVAQFYNMVQQIQADEDCFKLKDLSVNGTDLMKVGFPAGKMIGETLNHLLDLVMDDKIENEKNLLLEEAKKYRNEKEASCNENSENS